MPNNKQQKIEATARNIQPGYSFYASKQKLMKKVSNWLFFLKPLKSFTSSNHAFFF